VNGDRSGSQLQPCTSNLDRSNIVSLHPLID
jgi:hypothetical protein